MPYGEYQEDIGQYYQDSDNVFDTILPLSVVFHADCTINSFIIQYLITIGCFDLMLVYAIIVYCDNCRAFNYINTLKNQIYNMVFSGEDNFEKNL